MTLWRISFVLAAGLAVLLTVVGLRAEAARLNFEIAALERQADALLLDIRERELELARLSNPMTVRERVLSRREPTAPASGPAGGRQRGPR
jgi:hypothetical protein